MPVVLGPAEHEPWLATQGAAAAAARLRPYPREFALRTVGIIVNTPKNDTPDCIARVA
jgi:putative SOS response-associated peptidase YedK